PAQLWKSTHFRQPFDRTTPGFNDLRLNLAVRAEVCVACHVGNAEKDVNHDLIAAGHPRVRFELNTYLANSPRHWRGIRDREIHADLHARGWLIGQLVSTEAALNLLRERASNPAKVWPEFAEYDCYACHHDLAYNDWRQGFGYKGKKLGAAPLNLWY